MKPSRTFTIILIITLFFLLTTGLVGCTVSESDNPVVYETSETPVIQLEQETYTVTFLDADQNVISRDIVVKGEDAIVPEAPERIGHTFTGWDKQAINVNEDMTVTALFEINEYIVTFDSDGGNDVLEIIIEYGGIVERPENPIKSGYLFIGWEPMFPDTMPAHDLVLKAMWEVEKNPVTSVQMDISSVTIPISTESMCVIGTTIFPEDADNKEIMWTSSDNSVVKTDGSGNVIGVSPGKAVITATTASNGHTASYEVTVSIFEFDASTRTITSYHGKQVKLQIPDNIMGIPVEAIGDNAFLNNKNTIYIILPDSIKSLGHEAFSSGVASIIEIGSGVQIGDKLFGYNDDFRTLYLANGAGLYVQNTFNPYNWNKVDKIVPVTGLEMRTKNVRIPIDTEPHFREYAVVYPLDATMKQTYWVSEDPSIATCNSFAYVTGHNVGTTVITVKSVDGGYADTYTVTVYERIIHDNMWFDPETGTIKGHSGVGISVVVPSDIEGYPVKRIGTLTSDKMVSLVLPDGLEQIDAHACFSSKDLVKVRMPAMVSVGNNAFPGYDSFMNAYSASGEGTYQRDKSTDTWTKID